MRAPLRSSPTKILEISCVKSVAVFNDGTCLASGGEENTLRVAAGAADAWRARCVCLTASAQGTSASASAIARWPTLALATMTKKETCGQT